MNKKALLKILNVIIAATLFLAAPYSVLEADLDQGDVAVPAGLSEESEEESGKTHTEELETTPLEEKDAPKGTPIAPYAALSDGDVAITEIIMTVDGIVVNPNIPIDAKTSVQLDYRRMFNLLKY